MKKISSLSVIIILAFYSNVFLQDFHQIRSVIANVNADSLIQNLSILAGAKSVSLDGQTVTISSRYRGTSGNQSAAVFLKNKLSRYKNLAVTEQSLSDSGKNIIATLTGNEFPKRKIVLCAHYDSFLEGENSPGADDNATGTAAVLEAARIISSYSSSCTMVFAFFDREEEDLIGSEYFAALAEKEKDSIIAVINLDMLGWDKNGYNDIEVVKRDVNTSAQLAANVSNVNDQCQIGTYITITTNKGARDADNVSFWSHNFPAVLIIELYGYQNPFMHKTTDVVQNINKSFYAKCTKLGIAAAIRYTNLSIMDGATGISDLPQQFNSLSQNYPNPFNPSTAFSYQISTFGHVSIKVYDTLGKEVATIVNEFKNPGYYNASFSVPNSSLPSGVYFYRLTSGNFSETKKLLLLK